VDFNQKIALIKEKADQILRDRGMYNREQPIEAYFIHGIQDLVYELNKKIRRLHSLTLPGFPLEHDAVIDSAVDIINYAAMLGALIWEEEKKE